MPFDATDIGFTRFLDGNNPSDPIDVNPSDSTDEIGRSNFGAAVSPDQNPIISLPEEIVEKQWVQRYRGIGITTANDGRVWHNRAAVNYVNCKVGSSDTIVESNVFSAARDVNLWVARDAGHVYTSKNHCYGGKIGGLVEPTSLFTSNQDTFADSRFGLYVLNASQTKFALTTLQHNTIRDIVLDSFDVTMSDLTLMVQKEVLLAEREITTPGYTLLGDLSRFDGKAGIHLLGGGRLKINGLFQLDSFVNSPSSTATGNPCLAAIIVETNETTIGGDIIDGDGLLGSTGLLFRGHHYGCTLRLDTDSISWCLPDSQVSDPDAKMIRFDQGARMAGLDAVLKVSRSVPMKELVDLRSDWSGRITVWDIVNGKIETLSR